MSTVTVYSFSKWNGSEFVTAPFKATAEAVASFEAVQDPGGAEEVDESMVDSFGRYRPSSA